jgi:uncharacterized protein (DUF1778 family)
LENPRDYRITVRVDQNEKAILEAACEMTGKGKNEVIRIAVKRYYEYLKRTTE